MPRKKNGGESPSGVYHGQGAPHGTPRPHVRRKTDDSLAREIPEMLTAEPELDASDSEVGVRLVHNRLVVRR